MQSSSGFVRNLFIILSSLLVATFMLSLPFETLSFKIVSACFAATAFTLLLLILEASFKKYHLRLFNTVILGFFLGGLMGKTLLFVFNSAIEMTILHSYLSHPFFSILQISILLVGVYLGTVLTIKASQTFYLHIPFVKISYSSEKKKDVILDAHVLSDPRIIDFCSHGIFNHLLVVPKFIIKEAQDLLHAEDEQVRCKARKILDIIKKLQAMEFLGLRISDMDFSSTKDIHQKTALLAKSLDANVLTIDSSKVSSEKLGEVLFIDLNAISNSLKPLIPPGETISIKVQRYGKEPKQGVGYLEDGTMVVINNGGDYVGETIDTQVISAKQTSAGRIIFTNALLDEEEYHSMHHDQQPAYEH